MSDYDPANRWRGHQLNMVLFELFGDGPTKSFRFRWMLQHKGTLQVVSTMKPAGENKVTFKQGPRRSESLNHIFGSHNLSPIENINACYNRCPMAPYPNLVSDSTLVQETIDLLRDCGGRANAAEIVDAVFKVSHIDNELAGLLVADLVKDDRRFRFVDGQTIELQHDDVESRLLDDLDFVVIDLEATPRCPPTGLLNWGRTGSARDALSTVF